MNSLSEGTSIHVQGRDRSYKLLKQNKNAIFIATKFFLCPPPPSFLFRVSTLIYTTSLPSSLPYTWIMDGVC